MAYAPEVDLERQCQRLLRHLLFLFWRRRLWSWISDSFKDVTLPYSFRFYLLSDMFVGGLGNFTESVFCAGSSSSALVLWPKTAIFYTFWYRFVFALLKWCFSTSFRTSSATGTIRAERSVVRVATSFATCGSARAYWTAFCTTLWKEELWKSLLLIDLRLYGSTPKICCPYLILSSVLHLLRVTQRCLSLRHGYLQTDRVIYPPPRLTSGI